MKVSEKDFLYYQIRYIIWLLATYCTDTMCIEAPASPLDMPTNLIYQNGITIVNVAFNRILKPISHYSYEEQREILQKYLSYLLLPQFNLTPYRNDDTIHDIAPRLYVEYVFYNPTNPYEIMWNIVVVNDPVSYDYYKSHQSIPEI